MYLAPEFWRIYRSGLESRNLLESTINGCAEHGIHGGSTKDETEMHFAHRFPNSSSRVEAAILDPKSDLGTIPVELQATFSSGKVKLLDVPCGCGAATISVLTTLHALRRARLQPALPLDVEIFAADISTHALQIFDQLMEELHPIIERSGIRVNWTTRRWDAAKIPQTSKLCDDWLTGIVIEAEHVVIISNISGVKEKGFEKLFEGSIDHIAARISNCTSTLLWVEPGPTSGYEFLKWIVKKFAASWNWLVDENGPVASTTEFLWWHGLQRKEFNGSATVVRYERKPDV